MGEHLPDWPDDWPYTSPLVIGRRLAGHLRSRRLLLGLPVEAAAGRSVVAVDDIVRLEAGDFDVPGTAFLRYAYLLGKNFTGCLEGDVPPHRRIPEGRHD
jgi:hypothetical protein